MKRMISLVLFLIILVVSVNAAAFEIKIGSEVEVTKEQISLGEIAKIKALELSASQLEELKNLSFKKSPAPGYKKRLTRVLVDLSIKNLGYQKKQYQLKMPKTITVRRKSIVIEEAEIKAVLRKYLADNLDFKAEDFHLESKKNIKDLKIAAGNYELKISDQQKISLPNTNLKLEIWNGTQKIRQVFYPVKITLVLDVVVAKKNLSFNSNISKSDFKIEKKELSGDPKKIVSDFAELNFDNLKLIHSLAKGDILSFDDLKTPIAVKWGQKLHLKANINNVSVSTFVEAKERGKIGDIITVENLNSGYQFQVKVLSSTEVELLSD